MESLIVSILLCIILFFGARFLKKLKTESKPINRNLYFKDNLDAFKYASENYSIILNATQMNVGIVRDIVEDSEGKQFIIQLASDEQEVLVSGFNEKHHSNIQIGNLVYWGFSDTAPVNILQISAVGHVLATLSPELNPNSGKWTIKSDLTK